MLTVSISLNYLKKYVVFFWYVKNCSNYKAFFSIFWQEIRIFFNAAMFWNTNIKKKANFKYFLNISI